MDRRSFVGGVAAMAAGTAIAQTRPAGGSAAVRVAAASDLKFALADIADQYQRDAGQKVQLSLGSSGQFAQQIRQGLPVDLYMAADEAFVFQLADAGLTRDRGALYALGRIAALVPAQSTVPLDAGLVGLRAAWPGIGHFAIANPEHAPYGRAAQQALERLGLWELAKPRLVMGENIAQATQYVTSGAAQAGISALSLVLAPEVARLARHVALPEGLHQPLRQRMALIKGASSAAADFYAYLQTEPARALLRRYGFSFD
ncbi:molybdate ABC transporter substrate-binding protein [Ramlibacter sp. WS9]|uniref:molybdate ABC transporter substrate-binding protein n=1 Tax=Ramlibacter sp. WS9 TaxID=1882741 RepID=UPI0011418382|nr:molybdate ABC transporter substrate-binding protein [Ramlibacter sp. WS9]ROZ66723.1 molybdate ABC transporter substrate-binding protein [Ramlibacter sp. WS9]